MVVLDGHASLVARSSVQTAVSFTARLGVQPTRFWEIGDRVGNGRSGKRHEDAGWVLERGVSDGKEPLDAALSALLKELGGRDTALSELRKFFTMQVSCYASSDSTQGGFWLSSDVIRQLGNLGLEFFCTIYLDDSERSDEHSATEHGPMIE